MGYAQGMAKSRAAIGAGAWPVEPDRGLAAALRGLADAAPARRGWGETGFFEGYIPGIATAGALAAEFDRVVRGLAAESGGGGAGEVVPADEAPADGARWILDEALTPVALACRDALPPAAQVAFDAASLVVIELHAAEALGPRFTALARRWVSSPAALRQLAAIAILLGGHDAIAHAARVLAARPGAGPAISALCEAALAAGGADCAGAALAAGAPRLGEAERRRLGALLRAVEHGASPAPLRALRPSAVVVELDPLLAPEFGIVDALAEAPFAPVSGDGRD